MDLDGARWLVAGYGVVNWVWNVRAAGQVTLTRGSHSVRYRAREATPEQAAPVLRRYLEDVAVVRPYFNVTAGSSDRALAAEAGAHPVFHLEPVDSGAKRPGQGQHDQRA